MRNMLKQMLSSKKAVTMMASVVVAAIGHIGFEVDPDAIAAILTPVMAYIVGQGVADHGKEKARLEKLSQRS